MKISSVITQVFFVRWFVVHGLDVFGTTWSGKAYHSNISIFHYKPQTESGQQQLNLYMDRNLRSVAIMIEVASRHIECAHFNSDYSQIPSVAQQ